jgi:hypothetical protein
MARERFRSLCVVGLLSAFADGHRSCAGARCPAESTDGGNLTSRCHAAQAGFLSESPQIVRKKELTRAVLCDAAPTCVANALFEHEIFWHASASFDGRVAQSRCRTWTRDADWPTLEPHLSRSAHGPAAARAFEEALPPNRTVWLHGDSIQLQLCNAAFCSLMRTGVAPTPAFDAAAMPSWLRALEVATGYAFTFMELRNGARLMCSGIGLYQQARVEQVLYHPDARVDVAVLNFGLHYHNRPAREAMLTTALGSLARWRNERPPRPPRSGISGRPARRRVALWRESSAQHFRGGECAGGHSGP